MNILVTGSKGQLGTCIQDLILESATPNRYFFTDIDELDICDEEAVDAFIDSHKIDIVINCAAYTNVDKAEEPEERDKVFDVNARAVDVLARSINKRNGYIIHISTDYVFGGNFNNVPCDELQAPNPTGVYGKSKLEGEKAIAMSGCKAVILRTSWLYSEYGRNFVKTMLDLTGKLPTLKVVFDQCGTPTYARDLAAAILDLVEHNRLNGNEGIYNYSNEGVCSWFDFTKAIQRLSANNSCNVIPCHSNEFPSKVKRPPYSVLDKTKYKTVFGRDIPYWEDSLKKCIVNLLKSN